MNIEFGSNLTNIKSSDIGNDGKFVSPEKVRIINNNAFSKMKNLKVFEGNKTLLTIGNGSFSDCTNLEKVILPDKLSIISNNAFKNCTNLKNIVIPESTFVLGEYSFFNCSSLESIEIPSKIKNIEEGVFEGCTSLKKVKIKPLKDKVGEIRKINKHSFKDCKSLREITIPEGFNQISEGAFMGCTSLEKVDLPVDKWYQIEDSAFENCTSLKTINLSKTIWKISDRTFAGCSSLEKINLPQRLRDIGEGAFMGCTSLDKIELHEKIKEIGKSAFEGCSKIKTISLPEEISEISERCFANCASLKSITIPENVTSIGESAFNSCVSLKSIVIPETVRTIGKNAFSESGIKTIVIPKTVETMGYMKSKTPLYMTKNSDGGFTISEKKTNDSLQVNNINVDLTLLSKYWENRHQIINEQNNSIVSDFYNHFFNNLSKNQAHHFIENHNFTFVKQLVKTQLFNVNDEQKERVFNLLYNLGAFEPQKEYDGKKIDYAQKVVGFLQEKISDGKFDTKIIDFQELQTNGFNREFTDFFMKNYDELLAEEKLTRGFIENCYNNFDEVQKTNTSNRGDQRQLKPTVAKFRSYFARGKYNNVTPENSPIAETISPYFDSQKTFDDALAIDRERRKNHTKNNILKQKIEDNKPFETIDKYADKINETRNSIANNLTAIAGNEFSWEWLEKNDPKNFILGKLCSCCAHLEGAGYGIMHASIVRPYVQNLVIKNANGEIIAKSTLFVNPWKGYGICNNVEVNYKYLRNEEALSKIYQKYMQGIDEFAKQWNKEHPFRKLKQINVGMGHNDLTEEINAGNQKATTLLKPLDYSKYGQGDNRYAGDSFSEQYIVWADKNLNEKTDDKKATEKSIEK